MENSIISKLAVIQAQLKAPKSQRNNFGNYDYRSCEDILSAVKPLLHGMSIILADELVMIGSRYYIKATVKIMDGTQEIQSVGYAREEENKKGKDESQITGAASSYARKYALNGLLAIDDAKDSDATNKHDKESAAQQSAPLPQPKAELVKVMVPASEYTVVGKIAKEYKSKINEGEYSYLIEGDKTYYSTLDPMMVEDMHGHFKGQKTVELSIKADGKNRRIQSAKLRENIPA